MAYADQQMSGNRIIAIIIVALIHIALGYALVTGLAYSAVKKVVETRDDRGHRGRGARRKSRRRRRPTKIAAAAADRGAAAADQHRVAAAADPDGRRPPPPPRRRSIPRRRRRRAAAAAAASRPAAPRPRASRQLGARIQENYPAARACATSAKARVGVRVTVGPNGRVSDCSGHQLERLADLDEAACDGMQRYARFNPALDAAGNPTTGS